MNAQWKRGTQPISGLPLLADILDDFGGAHNIAKFIPERRNGSRNVLVDALASLWTVVRGRKCFEVGVLQSIACKLSPCESETNASEIKQNTARVCLQSWKIKTKCLCPHPPCVLRRGRLSVKLLVALHLVVR
jgi:hypothetical protein